MHKKNVRKARKYINEIERKLDWEEKNNPKAYKRNDAKFAREKARLARLAR